VEMVERRLPMTNLPESLTGTKMVQLSDLHIGPRVDDSYLSIHVPVSFGALQVFHGFITGDFVCLKEGVTSFRITNWIRV